MISKVLLVLALVNSARAAGVCAGVVLPDFDFTAPTMTCPPGMECRAASTIGCTITDDCVISCTGAASFSQKTPPVAAICVPNPLGGQTCSGGSPATTIISFAASSALTLAVDFCSSPFKMTPSGSFTAQSNVAPSVAVAISAPAVTTSGSVPLAIVVPSISFATISLKTAVGNVGGAITLSFELVLAPKSPFDAILPSYPILTFPPITLSSAVLTASCPAPAPGPAPGPAPAPGPQPAPAPASAAIATSPLLSVLVVVVSLMLLA